MFYLIQRKFETDLVDFRLCNNKQALSQVTENVKEACTFHLNFAISKRQLAVLFVSYCSVSCSLYHILEGYKEILFMLVIFKLTTTFYAHKNKLYTLDLLNEF